MKSREQPVSDLESGHRVATACHLANMSLWLGRTVRWDAKQETVIDDAEGNGDARAAVSGAVGQGAEGADWDMTSQTMNDER